MAYEIPGFSWTLPAAADLSASQFRFVTIDGNAKAAVPAAGARVIGVRQNKPKADEATTIMSNGISMVEAGGAITAGAQVATDATGRAVAPSAGNAGVGVALESASGAGVFIAVLLQPYGAAAA